MKDEERYCLGLLVEEMGESLQLIGKALRFGLDTPGVRRLDGTVDMKKTPRSMLPTELGDLVAGIDFSHLHGVTDKFGIGQRAFEKLHRLLDPEARDNLGRPLAPQPAHPAHETDHD